MGKSNNKKKQVSNIKNLEKAHPYSRKASQLNRAIVLKSHLVEKKQSRDLKKTMQLERLLFFQQKLAENPKLEPLELIQLYINRNKDEILNLDLKRRQKPKSNRQYFLEQLLEKDSNEFKKGFEIPDISNQKLLQNFINWNQDYNSISTVKMTRIVE